MPPNLASFPRPAALARRGLMVLAFAGAVAVARALSTNGRFDVQLVYSLGVSLVAWLTIDLGRFALRPDPRTGWPHGARGIALMAVGVVAGYVAGTMLGDAYLGQSTWDWLVIAPEKFIASVLLTVACSVAVCYFFYSRGKGTFLQGQIALAQRDATQAKLQLLQSQLEPHMLFNTLANLRALVATDPVQAERMLDHLIAYLRATLGASRALQHPLRAEFERLRDYLEIMAIRMGPRLIFTLDLPEPLAGEAVPALLLQPLVENSIRHGLEPRVEGGEVVVRARAEAGQLVLEVADTGVGCAPGGSLAQTDRGDGHGFGLAQLRERLATLYGDRFAIDFKAPPGGGTCVTIRFPLQKTTP